MDDSGDSDELDDLDDLDDFELEVTDLDTGQRKRVRLGLPSANDILRRRQVVTRTVISRVLAASTHHTASGEMRRTPLLSRARLAGAAALATLLLITVLVLNSDPGVASALSAFVRRPFITHMAPMDRLNSSENGFVAIDGVPWGTLLLDGKPDPRANTHLDIYQGSFTLPPGRHTLEYRAAPFPTLRCVVSVPADPADTCPLISPQQSRALIDPFLPTRILDLRSTPSRLPPTQQAALAAAVQAALAARAPVEPVAVLPGERYVTTGGAIAVATQPLLASYVYEFQWSANQGLRDCTSLCVRSRTLSTHSDVWVISAHVRQGWRYTTPAGAPVTSFAPPIASDIAPLTPSGAGAMDIYINLYVRWTDHWQVSALGMAEFGDPYAAPTCAVGFEALLRVMGSANVSFTPISSSHLANGCLFLVQHFVTGSVPTGQPLYIFFRFGVLLAVNDPARVTFPLLPAASPAEQSLARLIASQAGQPFP